MSTTNVNEKHRLFNKDASDIDRTIAQKVQEVKDMDEQSIVIEYTITERVQQIAELLEEKMKRAGQGEFINNICSLIIRMFTDAGLAHRKDTVLIALPDQYKLLYHSTSHLAEASAKPTEESIITLNEYVSSLKRIRNTKLYNFTRRQLQDLASELTDAADKITDFCTDNNIDTGGDSHSWINALYGNKPAPITLEKAPDALDSPNSDAKEWLRLSEIAKQLHQARMDYPNHDDLRRYNETNAVRALCNLLEPLVNRKYRYDPGQMNDMMYEAVSQSGTAAASHSGVICAYTTNPKTGLPQLRKITKEQLDAICLPFYNRMNHMLYSLPLFGPVIKNAYEQFRSADATFLAKRANEVGPKLQKIK